MTALELILPDRTRVALAGEITIGRAARSAVRLLDPAVSRLHAVISVARDGTASLADAGSSYGTWLDGQPVLAPTALHEGAHIRVGDSDLLVQRPRREDEAGVTVLVPETAEGPNPRLRHGYALKRLEAGEGDRRWVLKDLSSGRFVRLSGEDAQLIALLDGSRPTAALVREAERLLGAEGPDRLASLLAALGSRGLLAGADDVAPRSARFTRTFPWPGAGAWVEHLYRGGGQRLLTRPGLAALATVAALGLVAFVLLVAGRYGTPFVVAHKVGLGAVVFVLGRLAVAGVHEAAHGVMLASFGRRVGEAGLKVVLIFPYLYVDTSDAWFEPRRRRIAVSAAGPASDLTLGGLFALCCLVTRPGPLRDVFFQLAAGAYVGAFFNLNPYVDRDGYHILVDALRKPGLRRRAAQTPAYVAACLVWSALAAVVAVVLTDRYAHMLAWPLNWVAPVLLWLGVVTPVVLLLWRLVRGRS